MRAASGIVAVAALLAGCGDGLAPKKLAADLKVVVRPEGPGKPGRIRRVQCGVLGPGARDPVCRRLGGLDAADLAPVPGDKACIQVFGGPATARVEGTLRDEPVSARFNLSDGCEIARWRRNRQLLGAPPGALRPPPR